MKTIDTELWIYVPIDHSEIVVDKTGEAPISKKLDKLGKLIGKELDVDHHYITFESKTGQGKNFKKEPIQEELVLDFSDPLASKDNIPNTARVCNHFGKKIKIVCGQDDVIKMSKHKALNDMELIDMQNLSSTYYADMVELTIGTKTKILKGR